MESGFSIGDLIQEAQARWLKPVEVLFILQNHPNVQLTQEPVQKPASGSLYLFNKRVLRFFRRDGHSWRKKKDGRTVGEAHERLKVGNAETLNCYYAHGEHNPNFQRRSYWMLDPAYEHIVLVHYREITEGRHSSLTSPGSSFTLSQGQGSQPSPNPDSTPATSDLDSYQTFSSPGSGEVSSDVVTKNDVFDHLDKIYGTGDFYSPPRPEVSQALRRLEEQLSLDDDSLTEFGAVGYQNEKNFVDFDLSEHEGEVTEEVDCPREGNFFSPGFDGTDVGTRDDSNSMHILNADDNNGVQTRPSLGGDKFTFEGQSLYWKEMLDSGKISSDAGCHNELTNMSKINVLSYLKPEKPSSWHEPSNDQENSLMLDFDRNRAQDASTLLLREDVNMKVCQYSSAAYVTECSNQTFGSNVLSEIPFAEISNLTIAQGQKFTIREISPGWGYASDITKVIIVGSFLCEPSESAWSCLLGDTEVPLQIIQDGVLCFQAPPRVPGKVTLCITSGYREACSEIREFEFRSKPTDCDHCNSPPMGASMSPEELLLLVRFAKMLLLDPLSLRSDDVESGVRFLRNYKADDDSWSHVIETLLIGSGTFSSTMNWLLQELLKDKLEQWLSYRSARMLSKNERGIIHMVAGLGFEWALKSILCHGVNINFRDINGWTALHWAARFGREKMVAALIATGASAGAVTDPNSQDPSGKTAASIAASSGHKGLAGYLSEVALTSHLSSLTLEESELSKGAADVEAEITVNSVSNEGLTASEDQLSLKNTLAAVRNSALAAARIQSAFRAHSFRKRQLNEAASATVDEYGFTRTDIHGISVASKRDHDDAALSIQKKYRGWKGRKDFLDFRQKVVMIQAHVRGHQVRNKMICWAVGILEKVVLRWRRRGAGLRGYRVEAEAMKESEDEDILKVFRKERVEVALDQAVSRVLSMVDSPEARQQYHRVLGRFHQARAELGSASRNADVTDMEHAISQFL